MSEKLNDSKTKALMAAEAASSKKAEDIIVLDVGELLGITDFFVICSARNERQVATVVDEVLKRLREAGIKPYRVEGDKEQRWVLIDFLDIVVHVFHIEEREFYELERLWQDAPRVPFDEQTDEALAGGGRA
ncbi:MAG TPA: ribosome silencing factor [Actinomycetota bacterium]|nr:ribosome silencing factor [Actinomycetota bacterium]